jgi:phage-related protein
MGLSKVGVARLYPIGYDFGMGRAPPDSAEKPVRWVGSAKSAFLGFPREVISEMGYALGVAQLGGKHPSVKPWKGEGPGVFELVERFDGDTYRGIYAVRFEGFVYVLHAFQKKSPSGIRTAQMDVDLVRTRLKLAREHYEYNQPTPPEGKAGKRGE